MKLQTPGWQVGSSAVTESPTLAGRIRRLLATLVDAILVPSLTIFLVMVFGIVEDAQDFADNWWMLHVLLLAVLSYLLLNGYTLVQSGQTIGKKLVGIALVGAGAASVPIWRLVFVRGIFFALSYAVVMLPVVPWIALLPVLDHLLIFGKTRRCLHDLAAGTIVVRIQKQ